MTLRAKAAPAQALSRALAKVLDQVVKHERELAAVRAELAADPDETTLAAATRNRLRIGELARLADERADRIEVLEDASLPADASAGRYARKGRPLKGQRLLPTDPPTERQLEVLRFMRRRWALGFPVPSLRAIAQGLGLSQMSVAYSRLLGLIKRGIVQRTSVNKFTVPPVRPVEGCPCATCRELVELGVEQRV